MVDGLDFFVHLVNRKLFQVAHNRILEIIICFDKIEDHLSQICGLLKRFFTFIINAFVVVDHPEPIYDKVELDVIRGRFFAAVTFFGGRRTIFSLHLAFLALFLWRWILVDPAKGFGLSLLYKLTNFTIILFLHVSHFPELHFDVVKPELFEVREWPVVFEGLFNEI